MSELLPCPFCGSTPYMQTLLQNDSFVYYIICTHCDSAGLRSFEKEKAIERWNTRHYPPEVEKAVERMKPKKGVIRTDNFLEAECCYCPSCDTYLEPPYEVSDFCPECGQALDWSE